jgi:redox-sensitive bicupin YhaK (pirin superfamily)
MAIEAGEYVQLKSGRVRWRHAKGEPEGVDEVLLHRQKDGSYTHVLRIKDGVEFTQPVKHDFYEEAYYLEGEMLNTKTKETIGAGAYVFHRPGEEHGPFKCLKTCLILEFRYYK